jgi:hypothetical protein
MPFRLVDDYQCFGGICRLHLQGYTQVGTVNMEAMRSSGTLVTTYKTTRCHIPENLNRRHHHCENLKSQISYVNLKKTMNL